MHENYFKDLLSNTLLENESISLTINEDDYEVQFFKELVCAIEPRRILEIGVWHGQSALHWLFSSPDDVQLFAVDTFLGSYEHWKDFHKGSRFGKESLLLKDGLPRLFDRFKANIAEHNYGHRVTILPMCSKDALRLLDDSNTAFELIYIDGAHDFESVKSDLLGSLSIIHKSERGEGIIVGDDANRDWPQVLDAVKTFASEANLSLWLNERYFMIPLNLVESKSSQFKRIIDKFAFFSSI